MKLRISPIFLAILFLTFSLAAFGQAVDTVIGQFTNSPAESFAGGVSGDGRFVVFESRGNHDTQNPRNADGNVEIFLWDYAQRRIFQITDTKSVLIDPNAGTGFSNIRVEITNIRPVISNDGRWIAFSSNATTSVAGQPVNGTNPGRFDGNAYTAPTPTPSPSPTASPTPGANPLTNDANLELWLYQIPPVPGVPDLSAGDEQPLTFLSPYDANGAAVAGAAFYQITNTPASQLPRSANGTSGAFVADDNHDPSISDNGRAIAFVSTRDLVPAVGNPFPAEDNDEIFTYTWSGSPGGGLLNQVTKTQRGTLSSPIYNKNPTISGSGLRVAFASTGENPIVGMTGGNNPSTSRNEEIHFSDLDATGAPTGLKKQITVTTPSSGNGVVNLLDQGRRMSRDGRYIAFDSYADLAGENSGNNYTSFATYVYDAALSSANFRRIGPRSDADSAASGGDVHRYPGFTDYDSNGTPSTLLLSTRLNIKPDGTIPTTASDGMNDNAARPVQIYTYPLTVPPATATFKRLTKFPTPNTFLASTQALPSNTQRRLAFNLALTEIGTGNQDFASEVYYLINPLVTATPSPAPALSFRTGASGLAVIATPTPTPSPTATPTPTPTPSPSPTPQTPEPVLGLSPGMLAILDFPAGSPQPITARTAVGSNSRSFQLPIELSGVTLSINGVAAGLKSVGPQSIAFVVPPFLSSVAAGTPYPLVLNINGTQIKTTMTIVPTRPDIFNTAGTPTPGGRAKVFNATNRVLTREPFTVTTIKIKGGRRVSTVLRLYMTGIANTTPGVMSVKIGNVTILPSLVTATGVQIEPGVYALDFLLPSELNRAGDQPITVIVNVNGVNFSSRLADTAPRLSIL
ncbi:MAG: hypothetical protein ACK4S4_05565 [Pyrinomonadaceae bacterium]